MIKLSSVYQKRPHALTRRNSYYDKKCKELVKKGASCRYEIPQKLKDKIKTRLMTAAYEKCAYCETPKGPIAKFEVEHFRPINGITGKNEKGGYYWLTYEWTNLLNACPDCNGIKSTRFPILNEHKRAKIPLENGELSDTECDLGKSKSLEVEKALLLHPGFDKCYEDFAFLRSGDICGLTEKGKISVEIYGLKRKSLITARRKIIDDIVADIKDLLSDIEEDGVLSVFEKFEGIFLDLLELQQPKKEYSRLGWYIFNYFKYYIVPYLGSSADKKLISMAYDHYYYKYRKRISKLLVQEK